MSNGEHANKAVTQRELLEGFKFLQQLSTDDYHLALLNVATDELIDQKTRLMRLGRLIGVALKQPFSEPVQRTNPSSYTGAYREWHLEKTKFDSPNIAATWQYDVLRHLSKESGGNGTKVDVISLAEDAHHERGFFSYLAASTNHYICGNPALKMKIEENIKQARQHGLDIKGMTPELIVGSGGVALGTLLVTNVPILGLVGIPVIAGLVLIIYSIGIDAYCNWASDSRPDQ